jgi:hypothetical protein
MTTLEKLQELVRLVEAEYMNHLTEGPNGYCADDESVSADVTGDSPLTFGHIRRARAAINALPGLIESAKRVEEMRAAARRVATDLGNIRFNLQQGVDVPNRDAWMRMTADMEGVLRAALKGT